MFDPITLPFGAKMLFNTVKLKPGVAFEDVELAVGEMCNVVKETYGGDKGGFIAGQVFKFSGFISSGFWLRITMSAILPFSRLPLLPSSKLVRAALRVKSCRASGIVRDSSGVE